MTQDERWLAKYNEVMDFMETNHNHRIQTLRDPNNKSVDYLDEFLNDASE